MTAGDPVKGDFDIACGNLGLLSKPQSTPESLTVVKIVQFPIPLEDLVL
jgi:hypothetical protein